MRPHVKTYKLLLFFCRLTVYIIPFFLKSECQSKTILWGCQTHRSHGWQGEPSGCPCCSADIATNRQEGKTFDFFLDTNTFIYKDTGLSQAVWTFYGGRRGFNRRSLCTVTHQSLIWTVDGEEGWVDIPICKQVIQSNQLWRRKHRKQWVKCRAESVKNIHFHSQNLRRDKISSFIFCWRINFKDLHDLIWIVSPSKKKPVHFLEDIK